MDMKNNNCVVHVRTDSDNDLEALFNHVMNPKTAPQTPPTSQSVPMRERNLPPSFFKPPPDKAITDGRNEPTALMISHLRAHSSPASLTVPPPNHSLTPHHTRSATLDESSATLPPGWEMRPAPGGERYYVNYPCSSRNHYEHITPWQDPRKSQSTTTLNNNPQLPGTLPDGWEQAITQTGDIYYINHHTRSTSWTDPRLMRQTQNPLVKQENAATRHKQSRAQLTVPQPAAMLLQTVQREKQDLARRQKELLKKEIQLKRDILEEGGTRESMLGNLTRDASLGMFASQENTTTHMREESFDSGLGMGNNFFNHDVDTANGDAQMFDANFNSKDPACRTEGRRLPEFFDSLPGSNVDGIMEGIEESSNMETEDIGVGLDFNLNDVESVLSPAKMLTGHDNLLTWL